MFIKINTKLLTIICSGLLGSGLLAGPALAGCGEQAKKLAAALAAGDLDGAERLVDEIARARDCGPRDMRAAKAALADRILVDADRLRDKLGQAEAAARLIEKAAGYEASWKAARALGDLKVKRRAFGEAAAAYQRAIEIVARDASNDPTVKARLGTELAYLARRADETRHLAAAGPNAVLVRAPEDRDPDGAYSALLDRGPEAIRVPSAILFVYKSDEFTPIGAKAAEAFADMLKERNPVRITVTGHTDQIGSDAYNLELSEKRAKKVVQFLRSKNVTGRIEAAWKGKREPRAIANPADYTQDQIDELNRRVEFDWTSE
ncbi:OmpA family protein [Rhodoplanes sp. SY1]|uniref:OmpA family protein n=1 Tax=Rhodoplanes sp. SY1 TaxID=3166646 RepID=UPI0038B61C6F